MKKIHLILIYGIFLLLSIIYVINAHKKRDDALKNNAYVIATIKAIGGGGGPSIIYVQFNYNGKIINNSFGTNDIDSLGKGVKVRLLISKEFPDKYIKYIGVAQ